MRPHTRTRQQNCTKELFPGSGKPWSRAARSWRRKSTRSRNNGQPNSVCHRRQNVLFEQKEQNPASLGVISTGATLHKHALERLHTRRQLQSNNLRRQHSGRERHVQQLGLHPNTI